MPRIIHITTHCEPRRGASRGLLACSLDVFLAWSCRVCSSAWQQIFCFRHFFPTSSPHSPWFALCKSVFGKYSPTLSSFSFSEATEGTHTQTRGATKTNVSRAKGYRRLCCKPNVVRALKIRSNQFSYEKLTTQLVIFHSTRQHCSLRLNGRRDIFAPPPPLLSWLRQSLDVFSAPRADPNVVFRSPNFAPETSPCIRKYRTFYVYGKNGERDIAVVNLVTGTNLSINCGEMKNMWVRKDILWDSRVSPSLGFPASVAEYVDIGKWDLSSALIFVVLLCYN